MIFDVSAPIFCTDSLSYHIAQELSPVHRASVRRWCLSVIAGERSSSIAGKTICPPDGLSMD